MVARNNLENVCNEIKATERQYGEYLNQLITDFKSPASKILGNLDIDKLFSNVVQLRKLNLEFQADLKSEINIGELYKRFGPYYLIYSTYCNNYSEALTTLERLIKTHKSFRKLVKSSESNSTQTLASLLIMPIQRIPRHILLLKEFQKQLPKNDKGATVCLEGLHRMEVVAREVNEMIRSKENSERLCTIQRTLVMPEEMVLFETRRVLLLEDDLLKLCKGNKFKKRRFYLFNDCLVYARPSGGMTKRDSWQFRERLIVTSVERNPDIEVLQCISISTMKCFRIHCESRSILVSCADDKVDIWVAELEQYLHKPKVPIIQEPECSESVFETLSPYYPIIMLLIAVQLCSKSPFLDFISLTVVFFIS